MCKRKAIGVCTHALIGLMAALQHTQTKGAYARRVDRITDIHANIHASSGIII